MKKQLLLILVIGLASFAHSQNIPGFNLRFNRVIDTVMYAEANACNSYPNGVIGAAITVPAGKVWKVVATGPLKYQNISYNAFYSSCSSGSYAGVIGGTEIDPGGGHKSFISKIEYVSSSGASTESSSGQVWLSEGTTLRMVFYSSSPTSYNYTRYASSSSPFTMSQFLSIIEFNLQP